MPPATVSLDLIWPHPAGDRPHRGLVLVPGAHTGAMRERGDASSHQAAISPIRIANDAYHRRARAHAISRVELPPNATASAREQRLAEATHTWTTRTQALCKSAAMLAVAEPQSRRSRLTRTHPFGGLARAPPAESSLDPFTVAPLPGVGLTEAYRSCQEHMQATCTSAATLAVAVPRSRQSRSPTVHLIGGPAHTRHQPRRAVAYRIASSREHRLTEA